MIRETLHYVATVAVIVVAGVALTLNIVKLDRAVEMAGWLR